jgi:transposase
MSTLVYSCDLSDAEWQLLSPLIPPAQADGHPRTVDIRRILNGIFYLLRGWVVERTFAWLGAYRRLSKDYEFWCKHSESMIYIASIHLTWIIRSRLEALFFSLSLVVERDDA